MLICCLFRFFFYHPFFTSPLYCYDGGHVIHRSVPRAVHCVTQYYDKNYIALIEDGSEYKLVSFDTVQSNKAPFSHQVVTNATKPLTGFQRPVDCYFRQKNVDINTSTLFAIMSGIQSTSAPNATLHGSRINLSSTDADHSHCKLRRCDSSHQQCYVSVGGK